MFIRYVFENLSNILKFRHLHDHITDSYQLQR